MGLDCNYGILRRKKFWLLGIRRGRDLLLGNCGLTNMEQQHPDGGENQLSGAANESIGRYERGGQANELPDEDYARLLHAERSGEPHSECFCDAGERFHHESLRPGDRHAEQVSH